MSDQATMTGNEVVKSAFDNIRNLTLCALLIAAGYAAKGAMYGIFGVIGLDEISGWGLVAVGVVLAILNLQVGLSQLSRLPFSRLSMTLLCCVYVIVSARLVVVLAAFHTG